MKLDIRTYYRYYMRHLLWICFIANQGHGNDLYLLSTLSQCVPSAQAHLPYLHTLMNGDEDSHDTRHLFTSSTLPLFKAYPTLKCTLPHITLGSFPTPLLKLATLSKDLGISLYIKHDGLSGPLEKDGSRGYGGNKIRKLEFLLADALYHNAKTVLTFGCVGSCSAVATAASAQRAGLKSITLLKSQPNSQVVRKNLLLMDYYGSKMNWYESPAAREKAAVHVCKNNKVLYGDFPYVIPTGCSCPLGVVGFVNAIFELKEQIKQKKMTAPDYIYVASGTMGTVAGLLLGIKLAQLPTQLVAVCVMPENPTTYTNDLITLVSNTNALLSSRDTSIPKVQITDNDVRILYDCCGAGYGVFSADALKASKLLYDTQGYVLEGTYTAKAFNGLMRDAQTGKLTGKTVLFWNTYCSDTFTRQLAERNYTTLPPILHTFFEQPVQSLDIQACN